MTSNLPLSDSPVGTAASVRVADDVALNVVTAGDGPPLLLVHGFPHTWRVWSAMIAPLARSHTVIAVDQRGVGGSTLTDAGLDALTLSRDLERVLGACTREPATVVAIDAGVPPAFLLGLRRPGLVRGLVLVESTLGRLPGAEGFFAGGPPWWFGFHAVPRLAETVLAGHEAEYVGWFYDQGTRERGIHPEVRRAFGEAYAEPGRLAAALGYYRALPRSGAQLAAAVGDRRLTVPVDAVGAAPVGPALADQLRGVADDLVAHQLDDCGHIVPLDRPEALLEIVSQRRPAARPARDDRGVR